MNIEDISAMVCEVCTVVMGASALLLILDAIRAYCTL